MSSNDREVQSASKTVRAMKWPKERGDTGEKEATCQNVTGTFRERDKWAKQKQAVVLWCSEVVWVHDKVLLSFAFYHDQKMHEQSIHARFQQC